MFEGRFVEAERHIANGFRTAQENRDPNGFPLNAIILMFVRVAQSGSGDLGRRPRVSRVLHGARQQPEAFAIGALAEVGHLGEASQRMHRLVSQPGRSTPAERSGP